MFGHSSSEISKIHTVTRVAVGAAPSGVEGAIATVPRLAEPEPRRAAGCA
ncbi:MAG TPA: hypothetical protein VKY73_11375 [Polyangiaceae bacterium]|nr:hypothetical protein [Polyangiaceae bacterium]